MKHVLSVIAVSLAIVAAASAQSDCNPVLPDASPAQTDEVPYLISAAYDNAKGGWDVELMGRGGKTFESFVIQAISESSKKPIGRFTLDEDAAIAKLMNCGGANNAVTQQANTEKQSVSFYF